MNRLVLIGNGFDLSHKLKTSYKDFLTNYLWECVNKFYDVGIYDDPLISIKYRYINASVLSGRTIEKTFEVVMNEIRLLSFVDGMSEVVFEYKSDLLKQCVNECDSLNWVDIEIAYFDMLNLFKSEERKVIKLNSQFEYLQQRLQIYLNTINENFSNNYNYDYVSLITQIFKRSDFLTHTEPFSLKPQNILILNFNYTSTFKEYHDLCHNVIPTTINHIHGELFNEYNPIIFGFGDEFNTHYQGFENLKGTKVFKYIKSFAYLRTRYYHDLVRFTNDDPFQVFIIGHSCGLSDRTMLKHIFEHPKCKSIKIFHHGGIDDYTEKTHNIARHFTDKGDMRLKIAYFDSEDKVPQIL